MRWLSNPLVVLAACAPCLGFTWASVRMFLAGLVWQGLLFAALAFVTTPRWRLR